MKWLLTLTVVFVAVGMASAQCGPAGCSVPQVATAPVRFVQAVEPARPVFQTAERPGLFPRLRQVVAERPKLFQFRRR